MVACEKLLAPRGRLIFSTNFEGWTQSEFEEKVQSAAEGRMTLVERGLFGLDFELPQEERTLKSTHWQR